MGKANISHRISELRAKKRAKQKDVAAYLGVSTSAISEYESGRANPTLEKLILLSQYFGVSLDYLQGDNQEITEITEVTEKIYESPKNQLLEELRAINEKLTEQAQIFMQEITFLRKALEAKDHQIESKDKQIEQLMGKYSVSKVPHGLQFLLVRNNS